MTLTRLRQRKLGRLLGAILACALPLSATSQSVWNGSAGSWSASGNWSNNDVPGDTVNEDAIVNSGAPIVDGDFTLRHLSFGGGTLHGTLISDLEIQGTLTWSGGSIASDGIVNATGSMDLSGILSNAGRLTASITSGSINVNASTIFNNSGTLSVAGSTLNLRAGTNSGRLQAGAGATILFQGVDSYTLAAGSSLAGDGLFSIVAGVNLQESVAASNVSLSGTVVGGTLTTSGQFTWSGGDMKGGGLTTVSTGSLQVTGPGIKNLESRALVNNSTIEWSGGGDWRVQDGATVLNNNRFTISGDATMSAAPPNTSGTLVNAGTVAKSAGAGMTSILIPFNNTGTVSVTSGTLKVVGGSGAGTWIVGPGATMLFAANGAMPEILENSVIMSNSGTLINAGYLSAPAEALSGNQLIMDALTANELNIRGDLPIEDFLWNRGVISGPGISTTTGLTFDDLWGVAGGRTLENSGLLIWAPGALWGLGSEDAISAFDNVNPGTIQNNAPARIRFDSNGDLGLPALPGVLKVENAGEIEISDDKTASIHGTLNNNGAVLLGTNSALNLAAGGSSTGSFNVGDDSSLIFSGTFTHALGTASKINGIGSATADHDVLFDAATTNFSGHVGSLMTARAGADQDSIAVLNLLNGSTIQARSLILSGGSINAQSGAAIDVPALRLNGGQMTVHAGASVQTGSTVLGDSGPLSTLRLNSGATFQSDAIELNTSGVLWLDGGTLGSPNPVQISGIGQVIGSGMIAASVNANGGILGPGVDEGEIGGFEVSGGLTLDPSSFVMIDIDADTLTSDTIDVGGALELGGAFLFITVVGNAANLTAANSFVILSSAGRTGTLNFASINPGRVVAYDVDDVPVGEFQVQYTATEVLLTSWIPEPPVQAMALVLGLLCRRPRLPERQPLGVDCRNGMI